MAFRIRADCFRISFKYNEYHTMPVLTYNDLGKIPWICSVVLLNHYKLVKDISTLKTDLHLHSLRSELSQPLDLELDLIVVSKRFLLSELFGLPRKSSSSYYKLFKNTATVFSIAPWLHGSNYNC